jgi:hypothetical protein
MPLTLFKLSDIFSLGSLNEAAIKEGEWNSQDISRLEALLNQINQMCEYLFRLGLVTQKQLASVYTNFRVILDDIAKGRSAYAATQRGKVDPDLRVKLTNTDKVLLSRKSYIDAIRDALNKTENELDRIAVLYNVGKEDPLAILQSNDYIDALTMIRIARNAPNGMFIETLTDKISFPGDVLSKYSGTLLVLAPAGHGKTSFCRYNALGDTEKYNVINHLKTYLSKHLPE